MEKSNSLKIIVVIVILLIITSVLAVFLSNRNYPLDNPPVEVENPNIQKSIVRLKEDSSFFALQKIINDLYDNIAGQNNQIVYDLLEENYKKENNITVENAVQKMNNNYESTNYIAEEIYYNPNSDLTFYFINGYLVNVPAEEGDIVYYKDKCYLVIVDKTKNYVIKPLEDNLNIQNYANNYDIEAMDLSSSNKYSELEVKEKNKLSSYIAIYKRLLYIDTEKAYNMLDDGTKVKFPTIEDFKNNLTNMYNTLFTEFRNVERNELNDRIVYNATNVDIGTITITEYYPMEYKIGFNFI